MSDRLLLHVCCGPCSMYPLSVLVNEFGADNITGLFYNPNIHPREEFLRRRENALIAADHYGINLIISDDLMLDKWRKYGPVENKLRCMMCYDIRLEYAAQYAVSNGYNAFTTTLLVSPWQDHQYIIDKCNALAEKYGIRFHYEDYRTGYRHGQEIAKAIGLYRQKFCGCMWSAPAAIRESIILP